MFGMYDEMPLYFSSVGFTRKQIKRYIVLSSKDLSEMTEDEKAELKSMYEYASDKNNVLPEFKELLEKAE